MNAIDKENIVSFGDITNISTNCQEDSKLQNLLKICNILYTEYNEYNNIQ